MSTTITVCPDPADLAARAANLLIVEARQAIARSGRFTIALSGGSTPEKTFGLLAGRSAEIDWSRTWIFFGDERFVPPDDPRANFHLAQRTLLSKVPVPSGNIFPVQTWRSSPADAAAAYDAAIQWAFNSDSPRFDLILLGLGDDGHTASLFPGKPALDASDRLVTSSPPGVLPPPVERVTFTFPLINGAAHAAFLVAGSGKAAPVKDILEGGASVNDRPAAGVRPTHGRLTWLLDEAAAAQLSRK